MATEKGLLRPRQQVCRLKVDAFLLPIQPPMSNSPRLQHGIKRLLTQTLPNLRLTRRRNLARLVCGLYRARHVHLEKVADEVADEVAGPAQQTSKTRRLRRFLANEAVEANRWYRPVARRLCRRASESGPLRLLVLDTL